MEFVMDLETVRVLEHLELQRVGSPLLQCRAEGPQVEARRPPPRTCLTVNKQ
jgi:hypothetical protein